MVNKQNTERAYIFYSWQSDLPNATNRGFIGAALEKAVKRIRADESLRLSPVIDRDTKDLPGAPDIAQAIFRKIEDAQAFVADVSIINAEVGGRPTPNPNVLIELGYALRHHGSERILIVLNTAYGTPEDLPFDLRIKRVINFTASPNSAERSAERDRLSQILESGLRSILSLNSAPPAAQVEFDAGGFETTVIKNGASIENGDDKGELAYRVVPLFLQIANLGPKSLLDLECYLEFPPDILVLNTEGLQWHWRTYPADGLEAAISLFGKKPESLGEIVSDVFGFAAFEMSVGVRSQLPKYVARKHIKVDIASRDVRFHVQKLKQSSVSRIEPIYALFHSCDAVRSFSINCRIHADDLIVDGQLSVNVQQS